MRRVRLLSFSGAELRVSFFVSSGIEWRDPRLVSRASGLRELREECLSESDERCERDEVARPPEARRAEADLASPKSKIRACLAMNFALGLHVFHLLLHLRL
ncbi:MAG: hypothetical protein IJ113_00075 [Eggerthellaceae bacterium]|nr:hypothetical protein [Eggerthellaceae bacterium]